MHGGVVLLVGLLENGLDPGVMVLVKAVLGGIKARPPCPLSLTKERGGINTGGEPSRQWRSAEAAFKARQGRDGQPQQYSGRDWRRGVDQFGQGTWYLREDGCYNGCSSRVGVWGRMPRLDKTRNAMDSAIIISDCSRWAG
jgi:hypothetical protein